MTDGELEHRLTAVENRARSNTHRLDDLEKLTDAVNGMNTNIKLTIQQLENTNKSLEIVTAQNKKQAFCLRHGHHYDKTKWTGLHLNWLRKLELSKVQLPRRWSRCESS